MGVTSNCSFTRHRTVRPSKSAFSGKEILPGTEVIEVISNRYGRYLPHEFVAMLYDLIGDEYFNDKAMGLLIATRI